MTRPDATTDVLSAPERLEALQRSGLLDRTVVERLDSVAYTATRLLNADAAQINALDSQFQRTVTGYPPGHWPSAVPLEITGCRRVVLTGQPLIIPDTEHDTEVRGLPWTDIFNAYLGVPVTYEGEIIGSLCVLSEKSRTWTSYDILGLQGLANLVMLSLEVRQR